MMNAASTKSTFVEVEPQYSLGHYQREAVVAAWRDLEEHGRVLLHAPTGSGKTRMAMSIASMHLRQHGPTMVLWLAPTSELIDQAASAFQEAWKHHGDSVAAVIQWWGEGESFSHGMALSRNTVLVAGLQMAAQSTSATPDALHMLRSKATLIVFDEAHQSTAPTYRTLVEDILDAADSDCRLLGLSATPGRIEPSDTKALAKVYGDRKITVAPGYNPVKFLVARGYLAEANVQVRRYPGSSRPADTGDEEYPESVLQELGINQARNEAIVALVRELMNSGHLRIMVFTPSVSSAHWCADAMRSIVPHSHAIVGQMRQDARDHILANFRLSVEGHPLPQVIFNCRVLTAGVDLPLTSAVVIGKPTKSHVLLQQMIGRALRGPKSGGTDVAEIRILADESYADFGNLAEMFAHWDDLWDPPTT